MSTKTATATSVAVIDDSAKQASEAIITNITEKRMDKLNDLLGQERELHVLKGQLLNPVILKKKDGSGHYMAFRLKTLRKFDDDEYSQRNNMYQIIVSEDKAKKITSVFFRENKDQEVICLVDVINMTKKGQKENVVHFNNVSYYLIDIMKTRNISTKEIEISGDVQEL